MSPSSRSEGDGPADVYVCGVLCVEFMSLVFR